MRWVFVAAIVVVLTTTPVVIDAHARARSHKLAHAPRQRVLTPRHDVDVDVDVAAVETNANAEVNADVSVSVAVGYTPKQLAEGAPLADPTHYRYPAAQEGEAGLFPSDVLCVNAVNTLATSLNSGEMIGVLIDTTHRVLVTAVSGAGAHATYAHSYTAALGAAGWHDGNHHLSTYTIVDISDAHGQGWSDKLIDATGVTLGVRHKQPDGMKKIAGSLPADVAWGEGSRLQDRHTHEMGWPFGSCAGTKLAAYATMAGLTPFCMAERKRDTATIRASCRTCQTVISTLSSVSAHSAATDWMAAKTKTRDAANNAVTASEKTLDAAKTHAKDLGVHAPYNAADFTTTEDVIRAKILKLTGNARTKSWDGGPGAAEAEREVDEAQKQAFAWRCMTSYQKQKTLGQNNFGSKDLCKSQVAKLAALYPAQRNCPAYPELCLKKGDTKYNAQQIVDETQNAEKVLTAKQDALHEFTRKKEQFDADVAELAKLTDAQTKIETATAALARERATAAALALSLSTLGRQ